MTKKCPQDGDFIGDAGCTHPNHQHSELVKSLIVGTEPRGHLHDITPNEAEAALREGFYVDGSNGKRIGFGKRLLDHIDGDVSHSEKDKSVRKSKLMYAVSTVRHPDRVEPNHRDYPGRTLYAKAFDDFGMFAVSNTETGNVESVFTIFPRRGGRKR